MRMPLEGVRVLDLGQVWAGPWLGRLLADLGAEVIKLESIQIYDLSRGALAKRTVIGGYPNNDPGERPFNRRGTFQHWNRNKLGVTLNLRDHKAKAIFERLAKLCDVVTENFPPRVMRGFGVTYEELKRLKPDIIMLSMPAYGATGPEKDYRAFGVSQEQMAGHADLTGYLGENETPMKSGIDYGDPTAGANGAALILAALHCLRQTGNGQCIDVSQAEATSLLIGEALMDYTMNRRLSRRMGNRHPWMAPHGCYRCLGNDKWVTIAVSSDEEWQALYRAMGRPVWSAEKRFCNALSRWKHQDELDHLIQEWTTRRQHLEAMETLQAAGVPAGAVVNSQERFENEHLQERGYFLQGSSPEVGSHYYQGPPMKLTRTPITIQRLAPALGEHNEYIFGELLGLSKGQIDALEREQIIGKVPLPGADRDS